MSNIFLDDQDEKEIEQATLPIPVPVPKPVAVVEPELPMPDFSERSQHVADKKRGLTVIDGLAQIFGGKAGSTAGTKNDLEQSLATDKADAAQRRKNLLDNWKHKRDKIDADRKDSQYEFDQKGKDPGSYRSSAMRTLVKKQHLKDLPEEQRAGFIEAVDNMSEEELKQFYSKSSTNASVKYKSGVNPKTGKRAMVRLYPDGREEFTDIEDPFALATTKDAEGNPIAVDKVDAGVTHLDNKGQVLTDTEEKQYSGAELYQNLSPEDRRDVKWVQDQYKNDPVVKKARTVQTEFQEANQMLAHAEAGNPIDVMALATKMAKASGEVGNLAEHDKEGWAQNPSYWAKMQGWWYQKATTGEMSETDIEYAKGLLQSMQTAIAGKLEQQESRMVEQAGKTSGYTPEQTRRMLTFDPKPETERKVVKKQYSQKANKTKLIYADGTEEIVDGKR